MKKVWLMLAIGWAFSGTVFANEFAPECEKLIELIRDIGAMDPAFAENVEKFNQEVAKAREDWQTLSAEKKQRTAKQCRELTEQMRQLVEMLRSMQSLK